MSMFIGIDPGKTGGIAIIHDGVALAYKMPQTDRDVWDLLSQIKDPEFAMLEKVASSPQMGVKSAFTFGRGYGYLCCALTAIGVPWEEVTPQKWQRELGCLSGGDKNKTKAKAQQLFPQLKITHATADALLIAEYCRRKRF